MYMRYFVLCPIVLLVILIVCLWDIRLVMVCVPGDGTSWKLGPISSKLLLR
jgi:hypothetical protein